jgi:hypothetical protein
VILEISPESDSFALLLYLYLSSKLFMAGYASNCRVIQKEQRDSGSARVGGEDGPLESAHSGCATILIAIRFNLTGEVKKPLFDEGVDSSLLYIESTTKID